MKRLGWFLADDHAPPLERVVDLREKDFDIVACVDDRNTLKKAALKLRLRLIIADISVPGLYGTNAVRQLKGAGSSAGFIFLTVHGDPCFLAGCLEVGGFADVDEYRLASGLIPAVAVVLTNHTNVSPDRTL